MATPSAQTNYIAGYIVGRSTKYRRCSSTFEAEVTLFGWTVFWMTGLLNPPSLEFQSCVAICLVVYFSLGIIHQVALLVSLISVSGWCMELLKRGASENKWCTSTVACLVCPTFSTVSNATSNRLPRLTKDEPNRNETQDDQMMSSSPWMNRFSVTGKIIMVDFVSGLSDVSWLDKLHYFTIPSDDQSSAVATTDMRAVQPDFVHGYE